MQSLQKVEPSSTLSNCCKPKKAVRQVAKRACYTLQPTCNFSCNTIATQVAKKLAPRNTSCRVRLYFLQRLQIFCEAIASCSPRLHRVTCLLQLAMDFFPTLQDKLHEKMHNVKPALDLKHFTCSRQQIK